MPLSRNHPPEMVPQEAAAIFTALGAPARLHIVSRLSREGPLSISQLTKGTQLTRQAVTKHLKVLESADLAQSARSGREQIWRMDVTRLDAVRKYLDGISAQWDEALGRLQKFIEAGNKRGRQ